MDLNTLLQRTEHIALDALDHLEELRPRHFFAPRDELSELILDACVAARAGKTEVAQAAVERCSRDPSLRMALAEYREHVTWTERENAKRLATLVWVHSTLTPRALEGDEPLLEKLKALETLAERDYGVQQLTPEKGWAEARTQRRDLLPRAWRVA